MTLSTPASTDSPPRWERRKEHRPAELLDAALDCFVDRGYAATRLEDVATRAGVSKGTLYLYYNGKVDLFKAVVRSNALPLIEAFRQEIQHSTAGSAKLLESFFHGWWRQVGETRLAGIAKLIVGEAGNFPEVTRFFLEEVTVPTWRLLGSILERGIAAGEFRAIDVEAATVLWMSPLILKAIWMRSIVPNCGEAEVIPTERFLATHTELVLAALRPGGAR
jgi:AcrR family transcriptional regulator